MKTQLVISVACAFAMSACGGKDSKGTEDTNKNIKEPPAPTAAKTVTPTKVATAPSPVAPAAAAAPSAQVAPGAPGTPPAADAKGPSAKPFATKLVAALASTDPAGLVALAMTPEHLPALFKVASKACPDKMPADKIDQAVKGMGKMLGTAAERTKNYTALHAECRKLSDFKDAKIVSVEEKDNKTKCGATKIGSLLLKVSSGGKHVLVRVNDLMLIPAGWRMPDPVRCTAVTP